MFKILVLIFVGKIYKMKHLEGSGTPVLYIGHARFLKVKEAWRKSHMTVCV